MDLERNLEIALKSVLYAGSAIQLEGISGITTKTKEDNTPVSSLDKAANEELVRVLDETGYSIISEESDSIIRNSSYAWLIDPIDGTSGLSRLQSTINVALIEDGVPILGVIYYLKDMALYFGSEKGAYRVLGHKPCRQISVSNRNKYLRLTTSKKNAPLECFRRNGPFNRWSQTGSSFKFCKVARGGADVYTSYGVTKKEHDIAAGQAITIAAGGKVTYLDGSEITYSLENNKEILPILATNGTCHDAMVDLAQQYLT